MGSQRVGHDWATELNWSFFLFILEKSIGCLRWGAAVPYWCWGLHRDGPSHYTVLHWTMASLPSPTTPNYTFLEGKNVPDAGFVMPVWQLEVTENKAMFQLDPGALSFFEKWLFELEAHMRLPGYLFLHCLLWEGRLNKNKINTYFNIFKNLFFLNFILFLSFT